MSHIFISYANEDRAKAQALAQVLEQRGWSVWWDRHIPPGKSFDQAIEEAIEAASCVIVLWSETSVTSDWVKAEADEGLRRGILVPALIAKARIPLGFRRIQAADLTDWQGNAARLGVDELLTSVAKILGGEGEEKKPIMPPQQPEKAETSLASSQGKLEWRSELVSKEPYSRKIRIFLTNSMHVIDAKSPLSGPRTVEVDGEVVAQNDEIRILGWAGAFNFHIIDGMERRTATLEEQTHWFTDKITRCRLIIDNHILYSEPVS